MAIGRPEAIDGASRATAASAKDGDPAGFLSREEWRRSRQGKKPDGRHCAIGDRGAAGLRPDQPIEEAVWSGRLSGIVQGDSGDTVRSISWPAKGHKSSAALQAVRFVSGAAAGYGSTSISRASLAAPVGTAYAMPSAGADPGLKLKIRPAYRMSDSLRL